MKREKLEEIVKTAIVNNRAETIEQRERIYEAARTSLARKAAENPDVSDMLESVIAEIEASFAPPKPKQRLSTMSLLLGLVMGVIAGGGATAALLHGPGASSAQALETRFAKPVEDGAKQLEAAETYLRSVMNAVFKRQKNDPAFAKSEKAPIPLKDFDPELVKNIPPDVPRGAWTVIRANGSDVKLLMSWQLCGVAQILKPELVDPVRVGASNTIGCPYIGIWTEGAAKW